MSIKHCFINDHIFPSKGASIGINDLGLIRGYAAFELLRTYNGKPFRIKDHLQRLSRSAKDLHLPLKYSHKELGEIVHQLLNESQIDDKDVAVRFILTGGYSMDGITIGDPNLIISVEDLPLIPSEYYTNGVKLISYEFQRELPRSKTTDYLQAIKLQPLRKERNAFDVLYCKSGEVLEVTRNNFFIFKGNTLITPEENILHGITRRVVLELASSHFSIEKRSLQFNELKSADEAFLTGTTKKIIPVVRVDDLKIGEGMPGRSTLQLMELLDRYTKKY